MEGAQSTALDSVYVNRMRRDLQVATVCMDKSLRLWNFQDKSSELVKFFDEAPLSVSIHPSGLYLLLAFGERVRKSLPICSKPFLGDPLELSRVSICFLSY